jgi:DNA-binding HxlR family transcriptional regulator
MNTSQEQKEKKRPIMALIDLLGRKWLMRIIWELKAGACTFRELQNKCGEISPTIVNKRLKELVEARLIRKVKPVGYQLTPLGEELIQLFYPINEWVYRWEASLAKKE